MVYSIFCMVCRSIIEKKSEKFTHKFLYLSGHLTYPLNMLFFNFIAFFFFEK